MKPTHEKEDDQPCISCFRSDLMAQVLAYCDATDTTIFEAIGALASVQHDLLTMASGLSEDGDHESHPDN